MSVVENCGYVSEGDLIGVIDSAWRDYQGDRQAYIGERQKTACRRKKSGYKEFDFDNIESVTLDGVETAYRTETREEFDPVMSYYLTEQDGWQHYETETVEYQVEDGENYLFTIKFKNGTEICRRFHESSWLAERLLEYCNKAGGDL